MTRSILDNPKGTNLPETREGEVPPQAGLTCLLFFGERVWGRQCPAEGVPLHGWRGALPAPYSSIGDPPLEEKINFSHPSGGFGGQGHAAEGVLFYGWRGVPLPLTVADPPLEDKCKRGTPFFTFFFFFIYLFFLLWGRQCPAEGVPLHGWRGALPAPYRFLKKNFKIFFKFLCPKIASPFWEEASVLNGEAIVSYFLGFPPFGGKRREVEHRKRLRLEFPRQE